MSLNDVGVVPGEEKVGTELINVADGILDVNVTVTRISPLKWHNGQQLEWTSTGRLPTIR